MPSPVLTSAFDEAFAYACQRFAGRVRGNTRVPAIAHAMAVSALVLDMGGNETEAIAALLHDVVEDGGGQVALDEIRERWGDRTADLVALCSDEIEPSDHTWVERKAEYLRLLPSHPVGALRISLADKADNTRTLLRGLTQEGDALFARHTAGDRETFLWYYEALVAAFEARRGELGTSGEPLLDELERVVVLLRARSG